MLWREEAVKEPWGGSQGGSQRPPVKWDLVEEGTEEFPGPSGKIG